MKGFVAGVPADIEELLGFGEKPALLNAGAATEELTRSIAREAIEPLSGAGIHGEDARAAPKKGVAIGTELMFDGAGPIGIGNPDEVTGREVEGKDGARVGGAADDEISKEPGWCTVTIAIGGGLWVTIFFHGDTWIADEPHDVTGILIEGHDGSQASIEKDTAIFGGEG